MSFQVMQFIDGEECVHCERATYEDAATRIETLSTPAPRPELSIGEVGGRIVGVVDPASGMLNRVHLRLKDFS